MNEFEQSLIEQIKKGDYVAAKVYADYLEEKGKSRPRYLLRIMNDNEIPASEIQRMQNSFDEWFSNRGNLLILYPQCILQMVTDTMIISIEPTDAIESWQASYRLAEAIDHEYITHSIPNAITEFIQRWLFDNDMSIVHNSQLRGVSDE